MQLSQGRTSVKMRHSTFLLIIISTLYPCDLSNGHHIGPHYAYYAKSYRTCTGWFSWGGCSTKYKVGRRCQQGYGGSACSEPRCRYGYGHNTCNLNNAGYVKLKNGQVIRNSGGYCSAAGRCTNCNTGYYPTTRSGGYCAFIKSKCREGEHACNSLNLGCHHPAKCNLNYCSDGNDKTCEYCEGEHARDKPGFNVYTGKPDQTQCQRACSWVSGARCFPGSCTGYMVLAKDCTCAKGFGGTDCATANKEKLPTITVMSLKLEGSNKQVCILDQAISAIKWTNIADWSKLTLDASSHYKLEHVGDPPNYIMDYAIGIEDMEAVVTLSRDETEEKWKIDGSCTDFKESCHHSISSELRDISSWQNIFGEHPGTFKHGDRISFKISAWNGGTIIIEDRDSFPFRRKSYKLTGIKSSTITELKFDFEQPDHCFLKSSDCPIDALFATDIIKEPVVQMKWGGWVDIDSSIEKYTLIIYHLQSRSPGAPLEDGTMLTEVSYSFSVSSASLHLEDPGPYSIELHVYDHAGNSRIARRIVMYDNASVVELYGKQPTIRQTNINKWINTATDWIEIDWTNRFWNTRHIASGWLNSVETKDNIQREFDDIGGKYNRTINSIDHINGIVRFEIAILFEINGMSTLTNFETVPDTAFHQQKMIYTNFNLIDGERITFLIRGVDIMGNFAEDNTTAMIDFSPPFIKYIWWTKDKWHNTSVNNIPDLKGLTMEWEAYDLHSGLYDVNWKILDSYTRDVLVQSNKFTQGGTNSMAECEENYGSYPGGHNCYCTPHNGCFHKHFQVKPSNVNSGTDGFASEKHGTHGYFIEVTVTNNAGLTKAKQYMYKPYSQHTDPFTYL